jgi:hypothetical protein
MELEIENEIIEVNVFGFRDTFQLSKNDQNALKEVYRTSYRNSTWSEINPEIRLWYDSVEGKKWCADACDFYFDLVKAQGCEMAIAKDVRSKEIIAALFILTGESFFTYADTQSRQFMETILNKITALPEKTVYIGELFVHPSYRGLIGGKTICKMGLALHAQMSAYGMQHIVAWTLDRAENVMMYKKIGLKEIRDVKTEKGIDLFPRAIDNRGHYTKSTDGPAVYLSASFDQMIHFLARFVSHEARYNTHNISVSS